MSKPNLTEYEYRGLMASAEYDYDLKCYKIKSDWFDDCIKGETLCFTSKWELHNFILDRYDLF